MDTREIEKLKKDVEKAQGQRDLAEQARRVAVEEVKRLGQELNAAAKELAEVRDSRDENQRLVDANAELEKQAKAGAAAVAKAEAVVAAARAKADADAAFLKVI